MPESTTVPRVKRSKVGARPAPSPAPAPVEAPTYLGRYELLFEIGRGGMGSVHAARTKDDQGVERLIALKCLPKDRATKSALAALTAEAKITATIDHPNVVDTFESGIDSGTAWIAMRLVEGVPLSRAIERAAELGARVPPGLAAWIVAQAARGLHAAHALKTKSGERFPIVHRDVSPANLLVSRDGRVYVVDFGIAKLLGNDIRTVSGVIKGKFAYMSPEQTKGSDVDARSDIFSLGVVFYELLTGVSPFLASNPAESIHRINNVDPEDVQRVANDVPDGIAATVRRCLARSPDDRFATAQDLADALRSAAKSSGDTTDDTDVAAWIERTAGDDLRTLRDRITEASRKPMALPASTPPAVPARAASDPPAARLDDPAPAPAPKSRRPLVLAFVALASIGGIAAGIAVASSSSSSPSSSSSSPSLAASSSLASSSSSLAESASSASPASDPSPAPVTSTVASASASPTTSASSTTPIGPIGPRPPPSSSPATSAPPAKSSHKGEPFRTLGG